MEQLNEDIDLAETFVPMTSVERLDFLREILPLVTPANMPWKSREWKRAEWITRDEPYGLKHGGCQ